MRHIMIAVGILVLSGAVAAGSNLIHGLEWIRRPMVQAPPPPPVPDPVSNPQKSKSDLPPPPPIEDKPGVISIEAVLQHLKNGTATFVDAREPHEVANGTLRGAIHVPSSKIFENIEKVITLAPPDALVIVFCGGGDCEASHNVQDSLQRYYSYTNVVVYEKGWAEVMESGRFNEFIVGGVTP